MKRNERFVSRLKTMNDLPQNILTIDSSSKTLKLALAFHGDRLVKSEEVADQSHGQVLLKKIDDLINSAGISKTDLDALIVSTGPGSFTGLRIGIAAAKGIAVALGIKIISVNLFELAAYKFRDEDDEIIILVPFKKDEFFVVPVFQNSYDLSKLKSVTIKNFLDVCNQKKFAAFEFDLQSFFPDLIDLDLSDQLQYDASDLFYIGQTKIEKNKFEDITTLEPLYLQKSQAEIHFDLKNKK